MLQSINPFSRMDRVVAYVLNVQSILIVNIDYFWIPLGLLIAARGTGRPDIIRGSHVRGFLGGFHIWRWQNFGICWPPPQLIYTINSRNLLYFVCSLGPLPPRVQTSYMESTYATLFALKGSKSGWRLGTFCRRQRILRPGPVVLGDKFHFLAIECGILWHVMYSSIDIEDREGIRIIFASCPAAICWYIKHFAAC